MDSTQTIDSANAVEYPNLLDRVQSSFIDVLLIAILMFASGSVLDKFENVPDWVRIALFFGIFVVYDPLCTSLGFTLGNYIKGIRVRQYANTSKRINIFNALTRYIFKILLGWISFLTIHSSPQRRAIHDLVAGSVMIKNNGG